MKRNKIMTLLKYLGITFGGLLFIFLSVLVYRGIQARDMPDLQKWHKAKLAKEFNERDYKKFTSFNEYLNEEQNRIQACYNNVKQQYNGYNRYSSNSPSAPGDKNHSFELTPETEMIKAGVLLIHGLSDSPYHLRAIANIFKNQGYYVICLRLPGHGTIPGALMSVTWQDWYAAVEFGVREVLKKLQNGQSFYIGGFSTGGALTLRYMLISLTSDELRTPDKLFLLSPAIAVAGEAKYADWNKVISWIPYFSKFKWESIKPEYDPCKYNSFSKNAGDQIYELTKSNKKLVENLVKNDKLKTMPPVYAFQSLVDATVKTEALVDLFIDLGANNGELFLFDINRSPDIINFINPNKIELKHTDFELTKLNSRVTFITNTQSDDANVIAYTWEPENKNYDLDSADKKIQLGQWPQYHYALAHISIPIAPDDDIYGQNSLFGKLKPRGEKDVLVISMEDLTRLRYNPFFGFMETIIIEAITPTKAEEVTRKL